MQTASSILQTALGTRSAMPRRPHWADDNERGFGGIDRGHLEEASRRGHNETDTRAACHQGELLKRGGGEAVLDRVHAFGTTKCLPKSWTTPPCSGKFHGARDGGLEPMRSAQSLTPSLAPRLGLTHFRVCWPVFLLCALPSHRSASGALAVFGGSSTSSLEDLRAKPRRAFEIMDEVELRTIMVRTPPQGNHHLPCRARPSSHLSYYSFLLSLFLSTASRRKPHIVKFSGNYALRARLPVGSAQPATSVAGPSFAGRSGHNGSTLAATPRRTAALRPPEPPTKPDCPSRR